LTGRKEGHKRIWRNHFRRM